MFMSNVLEPTAGNDTAASKEGAGEIYRSLLSNPDESGMRNRARAFLCEQLRNAEHKPCDMPSSAEELAGWMERNALRTGAQYAAYLQARGAGQPRRYFSCRSHALSFLQRVAPTKVVDGAWLYGLLRYWGDVRFYPLIRTYLEELGDGDPVQNHVVLYQRLLATHGCENLTELSDDHFLQGAVQLALAYHADEFLPEVIGYNLGYEQLPLHLLISAFELNELDIDSYYFSLHVTIDNADSGHARKAVQSVLDLMPTSGDTQRFLERVANGYRLNELGINSNAVIDSFDLEQELISMLERKRAFGSQVHSDFCRIDGRTVNQWLSEPGQMPAFLRALERRQWVKRHEDPHNSRFWRLCSGAGAQMFGVFNGFEKQLLKDWIAGEWLSAGGHEEGVGPGRFPPRRARRKRETILPAESACAAKAPALDGELDDLQDELKLLPAELRMERLIELMAPNVHPKPIGLQATRLFAAALG